MTVREVFHAKTRELRKTNAEISTLAKRARGHSTEWPAELLAKMSSEIDTHLAHSRTLEQNLKTISGARK
jgi:hypothetical protein